MDLVCTVSSLDDDPDLLARWLRYYRSEGVTRFHVFWNDAPGPEQAAVAALLRDADVQVVLRYEGVVPEALRVERFSDYVADALGDRGAVMVVDTDELVRAPALAARAMLEGGFDYVQGTFVDRFGLGGATPALDPARGLYETFPLCAHFTYEALAAARTKVPIARPGLRYRPGVHRVDGQDALRRPAWTVPVDHFKWRAGIVERIRARVARGFGGEIYLTECRRFLDEYVLDDGRVDLSGITTWLELGPV